MKEDFLHYIWKFGLFSKKNLKTTLGNTIFISKNGNYNTNSGPDFLNAHLQIDGQLWVGNVEIHINASDWYLHHHEVDSNYDAVILHVVWEHDSEVFMKNNQPIPTLVLKDLVDAEMLNNYKALFTVSNHWIPCEKELHTVDSFTFLNWKERLFFERLVAKSEFINELLKDSNGDFEAVLFRLLAKNFGLKINGEAFLQLAKSMNFSVVKKERNDAKNLAALFFGQAGFLEDEIQDSYFLELQTAYHFLKYKHQLESISKNHFSFFRMRPHNFPTVRIAQFVALFSKHQNIFSKVISLEKLDDFYSLFSVRVADFWKTHFTFETPSKNSQKKLTKSFIDLLLINTIIPLKFVYQKSRGVENHQNILNLIQQIKPEKNGIISKFETFKVTTENAFDSQALLELKNKYCVQKRCLDCAIGNSLLRK